VLATGGIVALGLGSLMLFDAPEAGFRVSGWVVLPTVGVTAGVFLFVVAAGVQALRSRSPAGGSALVGQTGVAREALSPEGHVLVNGELWRAVARDTPVAAGSRVRVVDANGLTLTVEKTGEGGAS
jgi:membrane-bound serine protease (ClpP class)